jgi:hypothetical protein
MIFVVFWFCAWIVALSWFWPCVVVLFIIIVSVIYILTARYDWWIGDSEAVTTEDARKEPVKKHSRIGLPPMVVPLLM